MSQHIFCTLDKDGGPLEITMGWDRPLGHLFMTVQRTAPEGALSPQAIKALEDHGLVYSSLNGVNAFEMTTEDFRLELGKLGLEAPESMYLQVNSDQANDTGNRLAVHQSDGSFVDRIRYNEDNTLEGDVLVVDESGMNDVELAEAVVAASNSRMHVIFLGDTDQLPSIGPGTFLKDVLQIKAGDHHRLTTTHRNSGGILDVIEQIRNGSIDCIDRPGVTFSHGLLSVDQGFPLIARKYIDAVSKHGFEGVALLMSMRAGEPNVPGWNITYANQVLRDLCNPHAVKIPGTRLFVGDRIIIRENMTVPLAGTARGKPIKKKSDDEASDIDDTRVVNGDTGTITSYERDAQNPRSLMAQSICLKLDDGRMVDLPGADAKALQHSYALTVHSAQGSEYKKVIAVATPGHSSFINRAMIFTGLSRARESLDINADDQVLRKIAATPPPLRNSALVERVLTMIHESREAPVEDTPAPAPAPVAQFPRTTRAPARPVSAELSLSERYAMRMRE